MRLYGKISWLEKSQIFLWRSYFNKLIKCKLIYLQILCSLTCIASQRSWVINNESFAETNKSCWKYSGWRRVKNTKNCFDAWGSSKKQFLIAPPAKINADKYKYAQIFIDNFGATLVSKLLFWENGKPHNAKFSNLRSYKSAFPRKVTLNLTKNKYWRGTINKFMLYSPARVGINVKIYALQFLEKPNYLYNGNFLLQEADRPVFWDITGSFKLLKPDSEVGLPVVKLKKGSILKTKLNHFRNGYSYVISYISKGQVKGHVILYNGEDKLLKEIPLRLVSKKNEWEKYQSEFTIPREALNGKLVLKSFADSAVRNVHLDYLVSKGNKFKVANPEIKIPGHPPKLDSKNISYTIDTTLGYPRIKAGDKILTSLAFCYPWYYPWRDKPRNKKAVTRSGINSLKGGFKIYRVGFEFGEIWDEKSYDQGMYKLVTRSYERGIDELISINPQARLIVAFRLTGPPWWVKKFPEEVCKYSDGEIKGNYRGNYGILPSMASEKWIKDTKKYLTKLVNRFEQKYGDRIIGYMPCSHAGGPEWWMSYRPGDFPDYSKPMVKFFRAYLRRKYKTDDALKKAWKDDSITISTAEIPGRQARGNPKISFLIQQNPRMYLTTITVIRNQYQPQCLRCRSL